VNLPRAAALACLSLSLSGCAVYNWLTPPASRSPRPGVIERALEDARAQVEPPAAAPPESVQNALLPPLGLGEDSGLSRFDVSVKDMSAREFLLSLVADSPTNLTMDANLTGTVTLTLKGVTIEDVLSALRDVYGYSWERRPYGYHIGASGLQTRIFQLNYLDLKRTGSSQTRVSSGQVSERPNRNSVSSTQSSTVTDEASTRGSVSGSMVRTDSEQDFWKEIDQGLVAIVGNAEGRNVVTNPASGVVVVHALPEELREVEHFLTQAENSLNRQVILEAKILEVSLDDGFQSGINWAQVMNQAIIAQTGGGSLLSDGVSEIAGAAGNLNPAIGTLPSGTASSAFGGAFTGALNFHDFTAFIELLETQGKVRTLSSPRISTINNQKAVIKVGTDEFFVTDISTTTVTSTTTTITPTVTLTPFFSGIALDVTPQISEAGDIVLHIHPSISQVNDQLKTISLGTGNADTNSLTLPLARSTIRESDSVVRAHSGQVIVLGGLMQDREVSNQAGTPWFDRIPLAGWLFRQQKDVGSRTELVILLRAVDTAPANLRASIDESARRVEALRHGKPWLEPATPAAPAPEP
jgi:MSHA biogenesis protein MshL